MAICTSTKTTVASRAVTTEAKAMEVEQEGDCVTLKEVVVESSPARVVDVVGLSSVATPTYKESYHVCIYSCG